MAGWLTIDDLNAKSGGCFKFVRMPSGEFRFSDYLEHKALIAVGETVAGAGTLFLFENCWRIEGRWSMSLKVAMGDTDEDDLAKLIRRPKMGQYD